MSSMGEKSQPGIKKSKWEMGGGETTAKSKYLSLTEGGTSEREKEQVNVVWKVGHEHCYQVSLKNTFHFSMGASFKTWGLSEEAVWSLLLVKEVKLLA